MKWRKSSRSQSSAGQCVEVAAEAGNVLVRDSKNPEGAVLACPRGEWGGFLASSLRQPRQ
ncbi:DUF397 domain-containing protein [Phytomonospora endophytica]|uniref:DUF397 domain-containing protein n=1 Tax=Phytomonospora endophytica TaxID=714109 RepID=A0A841FQC5_9ACTN|nr:DUF397 domain-containing protein [Phytomonospora endophytica]MBB6037033.1 hypothetical protein [Phytomonospora endophytica]GIG69423.1 hypothetical protein Pen01_57180 [Phytomonospora endophytica]